MNKLIQWILCLSLSSVVFADGDIAYLSGIKFLGNPDDARCAPQESFDGVVSDGVALFEKNPGFLQKVQKEYVGKRISEDMVACLKQYVCDYYEQMNQPFAFVRIPRQDLSSGVLQVVIEEAKLGEVRVEGNCYFSGTELADYIQTKPGSPIVMQDVLQDVSWMNQNPFRRTDAVFVPGSKAGTADIELMTTDRWPYRVYAGADNTGTISTQRDRIFFGFDFGKTVIRDSQVSYQFSCSPNWNRFFAHTASARIPCPWRHVAILYGGYAQVEPSIDINDGKAKGKSWQVDGRYRIPLMHYSSFMQELVFGYDFKETSDWVKQDHHRIFKAVADINQFMFGYELGYKGKGRKLTLVLEGYVNPGGITNKNKTSDYRNFRSGAKSQYCYLKFVNSYAQKIERGWWLSYDLSGQISSANLLPSEQFTLAGYNAVRGFEERIVSVDNAVLLNLEIETPHMSPSKCVGKTKKIEDDLYFIAFFDCGFGVNHIHNLGESRTKTLASIGPGIRYQYSRFVTGRLDYGYQLWHSGFENPSRSRYNFGLIISY